MVDFIVAFLNAHPEMKDHPLFLSGESYAGKYIPNIAMAI